MDRTDPTGMVAGVDDGAELVLAGVAVGVLYVADKSCSAGSACQQAAAEGLQKIGDAGTAVFKKSFGKTRGNADNERKANIAKGTPESKLGPSGKPKVHTVDVSTRKGAREGAQRG